MASALVLAAALMLARMFAATAGMLALGAGTVPGGAFMAGMSAVPAVAAAAAVTAAPAAAPPPMRVLALALEFTRRALMRAARGFGSGRFLAVEEVLEPGEETAGFDGRAFGGRGAVVVPGALGVSSESRTVVPPRFIAGIPRLPG